MSQAALAKIHIAQKELGLDDATYRAVLVRCTGQSSSAKMTGPQRDAVVKEFIRLGWKPRPTKFANNEMHYATDKRAKAKTNRWRAPSENPMHRKIWALGKELDIRGYWKSEWKEGLRKFVKKETGVDDIDWLETKQASNVIEALKSIVRRM